MEERGPAAFTAHFSYLNEGPAAISVPIGPDNLLSPDLGPREQPTSFQSGRTTRYPRSAFRIDFGGSELTWTLRGPDGVARSATASASSRRCGPVAPGTGPRIQMLEPLASSFVDSATPRLRLSYEADGPLDLASFRAKIDGGDQTALFKVGPREASATIEAAHALGQGVHRLEVSLSDTTGRAAQAAATFTVDTQPPRAAVSEPSDGSPSADVVDVTGTVIDNSPVTVKVNGIQAAVDGPTFHAPRVRVEDSRLQVVARDAAGNASTLELKLSVQREAPAVRIESPRAGARVRGRSLTVSGTVKAAGDGPPLGVEVNGQMAAVDGTRFRAEVPVAAGEVTLTATAGSGAGPAAVDSVTVTVGGAVPALVVDEPAPESVLRGRTVTVSGRSDDPRATLRVSGAVVAVRDDGAFVATVPLAAEGEHTIVVTAEGGQGIPQRVEIPVRVDRTPPALKVLTPADGETRSAAARLIVQGVAEDATAVEVRVNGAPAERIGHAWRAELGGLREGRQSIQVTARDQAGNETRVARSFVLSAPAELKLESAAGPVRREAAGSKGKAAQRTVAARTPSGVSLEAPATGGGIVVGQVLSDATGLPVSGATVRILSGGGGTITADERGRYAFPSTDPLVVVSFEQGGMTTVERLVVVESGVGTVPVDARLTPLAAPVSVGGDGGVLQAEFARRLRQPDPGAPEGPTPGRLTITLPAQPEARNFGLTALSPQGLPALLPLGFSPIAAFNVQGPAGPLSATAQMVGLPELALLLAAYDQSAHAWRLAEANLQPASGALDFALAQPGSYALATVDAAEPPLTLPAVGGVLTGLPFRALPEDAQSRSLVDPPSLPAAGGKSRGRLVVDAVGPMPPSGTVVQAVLTESFTLVDGQTGAEEERLEDIVLYRADLDGLEPADVGPSPLGAELPIVPARSFEPAELAEGRVHLEILAGREGVRGTVGGSGAVTVTSGGVALAVPAGALPGDTVISIERHPAVSAFVPQPPGFTVLAEVSIDLAGAVLSLPAELSVPAAGTPAGGSFFVARVEQVEGLPKVQVVAWAERAGARVATHSHPNLPGVRQGGRYVFYHASPALGFLAGLTRTDGQPVPALVSTSSLPFVDLAGIDGAYVVLTLAGPVFATARVLGTALTGTARTDVASGSVAALNIDLAGAVTVATVTPANGATGVRVTSQIDIEAPRPLDPVAATFSLRRVSDGAVQTVRTLLSASGRRLAVIPQATLAHATEYTLEVTGLKDSQGGTVAVPPVNFTTQPQSTQALNPEALVFSYPVDGVVTMSAPAGTFPAGTQILVINPGNGQVIMHTVGALPVHEEFGATIDDVLMVTIRDPQGNEVTFERSEYVAPDGKTGVGIRGGKVRGPEGSELRLPDGALDSAVTIKLSTFTESELPAGQRPDLPGANFGGGLKIWSPDQPTFNKEVDLVFPKPADAPPGAFFYVYRKLELPGGRVSFQTIDQAFIEGDKVVTASPPFSGYMNSFGGINFGGVGGGALMGVAMCWAFMMWTFDEIMPGRAMSGVITGQVLRTVFDPGVNEPRYEGIPDAVITGVNEAGLSQLTAPGSNNVSSATSGADGTFTMIDAHYTGGLVKVSALTPQGETKAGTAFQSSPMDSKNYNLRFFSNIARVTITFDPLVPPPGSAVVDLDVVRVDANGQRFPTDGLIVEGARLRVGIHKRNATVEHVRIGSQELAFQPDDRPSSDPLGFDIVSEEFVATPAGTYRVEVSARGEDLVLRTVTRNIRFVPEGGGNNEPDPDNPPAVIEFRSRPRNGATEVPVTFTPHLEFSEPVRRIPGNVRLWEISDNRQEQLDVRLIGVPPNSTSTIDVTDPSQSEQPVVVLVIEPQPGLKYDKTYRLELSSGIVDLDLLGGAKPLQPFTLEFSTLDLPAATGQGTFPSPGIAVQDGWAYLVHNQLVRGLLKVFDVRDPLLPRPVPSAERSIGNRPTDLASKPGRLIVGTTSTNKSKPSNVHVFNIENPADPQWVGVASVSNGAVDGLLERLVVRGNYAYAMTDRKGIQTVDLRKAETNYAATGGFGTWPWVQMNMKLNTDGQGFGFDAVVSTIPIPVTPDVRWHLRDLDVGDYPLNGRTQPVAFVAAEEWLTGKCQLLVGNPQGAEIVKAFDMRTEEGDPLCPVRVALGRAGNRDLAVVGAGLGSFSTLVAGWGLAVVDVSDPRTPQMLGFIRLDLPDITDVVVDEETALVASSTKTELVNLASPEEPYAVGSIAGLAGRLAVGESGTYFSTGGAYTDTSIGGLHVAQLNPRCDLLSLRDERIVFSVTRNPDDGSFCGGTETVVFSICQPSFVSMEIDGRTARLNVDGEPPQDLAGIPLGPGLHVIEVPFGELGPGVGRSKPFVLSAVSQSDPTHAADRQGKMTSKLTTGSVLPVGHTFVKGVDLADGHLVRQATDIKIAGRHLGLEVTRTYSSAGQSEGDVLGAGWAWNYASAVTPGSCGHYSVTTADGSSQTFKSTDGGNTFTPEKGYHTRLNKLQDGTFEFIDKAGVRHYYKDPADSHNPQGRIRLDRIVEPHGDRIEMIYDVLGRVSSVREVLRGERPVRWLTVRYERKGFFDRVASVRSSLGHEVEYDYDAMGNLIGVRRSGENVDGQPDAEPTTETYEYSALDPRDGLQMIAAVGPNLDRTEYVYYAAGDPFPGEGSVFLVASKEEWVKEVREAPGRPEQAVTRFLFDYTQTLPSVPSPTITTTVTDARDNLTKYVMNLRGNSLRIEEPLGKVTINEWALEDILKTMTQDAQGQITRYEYSDTRGNLTAEQVEKDGLLARTEYRYHPEFNKLEWKKDPEGHQTTWSIDDQTGDLKEETDAVGNRTVHTYDAEGRLKTTRDPRGHTTNHQQHNDFGSPQQIVNPLSQVTTRTYDSRNRLIRERQEPYGRETLTTYDGFDRPVRVQRLSGRAGGDEITETSYYPGGQQRSVTNPLGGTTTFTLDAFNRVVATSIAVGAAALTTAAEYDGNGNLVSETDRRGVKRQHHYDELNRRDSTSIVTGVPDEGPIGVVATYHYDLVGNKDFEIDLAGWRTDYAYDGLYRVKTKWLPVSLPLGRLKEEYVYDRVGNLVSHKDANGQETIREYDGLKRVTRLRNAEGHETLTVYNDPEGSHVNRSRETQQPRGLVTEHVYDRLNRETGRTVRLEGAGGDAASYLTATAYLDDEHSVQVTDARGTVTKASLDGLDREIARLVDVDGLNLLTTTEHDGAGNKTRAVDARGNATVWRYDALGRLTSMEDAKLQPATFTYDGEGLKLTETDRRGVTRTHTYDNLGRPRLSRIAEGSPLSGVGWSHQIQYQDAAHKRLEIDARGYATTSDLDGLGRVVKETDARNKDVQTTWDGVNRREVRDKRGHATRYEYDRINRLVKTTDPVPFESQMLVTTYGDAANLMTETDRRGTQKVTQLDPLGRVRTITRDGIVLERNTYDGLGNKVLAEDGESKKTSFVYDKANRLSQRIDGFESAEAATTVYAYDPNGNLADERDQRATDLGEPFPSTKKTYDELNRLLTVTDGEANVTTYGYDEEGNRTLVREPEDQETTYAYDELGKLTRVVQPGNTTTRYRYDRNRNKLEQEDARGKIVAYQYDQLNRLTRLTQPGAFVTQHEYDENGNETLLTDPKGQTVTSTYDELNRLETKTYGFASGDSFRPWRYTTGVTYTYDPNGNLTTAAESLAGTGPTTLTTWRVYDRLDRLTSEATELPDSTPAARTVSFAYWGNGARKSVNDSASQVTWYAYDGQNRLQSLTTAYGTPEAATTTYSYWPDNLLKEVTLPSGVKATHSYDKADRLTGLLNAKDASVLSSYAYTYDKNGNRLSQVEQNGGATESTAYTYDDLNRLETVTYPVDATYPNGRKVTYGYDAVGNRTHETERDNLNALLSDKEGVFDNLNRLTALNDLLTPANSTTFSWDDNGNQTTKTKAGVTTSYHYDIRDKLVEVGEGASILGRFQYDFEGRRNVKIGEFGTEQYVYDGTSTFLEFDAAGALKAKYDYGSDRLIGLSRLAGSLFERRYYSFDALRSVTNLSDTSGAVKASYHLDAWGNFRFPQELNADGDTVAAKNRFAFTGYLWDKETNLFFAKARFYDPEVGRFISQDSYLGQVDDPPSLHRYFYANDNPTRYVDLTGHAAKAKQGYLLGDEPLLVTATDETTVYASPTLAQLQEQVDVGELDQGVAAVRGAGGIVGVLRSKPDYEKSYARNLTEQTLSNIAETVAAPGLKTFEGLANQDLGQFGRGLAETAVAGAIPLVVKEGGAALVSKATEKAPWLLKEVRDLGGKALERGKVVLEGATEGAKRLLKAKLEFDPTTIGSNLGNVKVKLPPKAASAAAAKKVTVSRSAYPEEHELAQASGNPTGPFTKVDKATRDANRKANLQGTSPVPGKDRGEWPPAMTAQGKGATVKPIDPSQNRGSGATMGNQTRDLKPGDRFVVVWED